MGACHNNTAPFTAIVLLGFTLALFAVSALYSEEPKTLFISRGNNSGVLVLEAMSVVGLDVRQEAGSRPVPGEILNCNYRAEPFFVDEKRLVSAKRIRLICNESEFIVEGLVF